MHRSGAACRRWAAFASAGALLVSILSTGATAGTTGKIAGVVTDEANGSPIPGVAVTINELKIGATTDADGHYFLLSVPPGTYNVVASLVGYAPVKTTEVVVNIDRTTPLDFGLTSAAIEVEAVTVTARREVIHLDVAGSRSTLDAKDVAEVPTVTSLQAAINQEPNVSGTSIRGGLPEETQLMLNGHVLTDSRHSTFNVGSIPLTSVQEVQILTSGFNAEYGNIRSGVINVVMRDDPRNYWVSARGTYMPRQMPTWGGQNPYGKNTPEWRIFGNDSLVPYKGEMVPKSLVTPYWAPGHDTTKAADFLGWINYLRRRQAPTLADSIAMATEALVYWQHRHDISPSDYAKDPGYTVDASGGGPVPFISGLSFTYSHRNTSVPYALASQRSSYRDYTEQLSLTYRIGGAARLGVTGQFHDEYGNGTTYAPQQGGFAGGAYEKYAVDRGSPVENRYFLGGVSFTHILSKDTQYELNLDAQHNVYGLGLWPYRYLPGVGGNPVYMDHALPQAYRDFSWMAADTLGIAPWGHSGATNLVDEASATSGFQYDLGGSSGNSDSSTYTSYKIRASITSQITEHHNIKAGVESDFTTYHNREIIQENTPNENQHVFFDKSPTMASAYVQDKVEYQGMVLNAGVRMDYFNSNSNVYNPDSIYASVDYRGVGLYSKDKGFNADLNYDFFTYYDSLGAAHKAEWEAAQAAYLANPTNSADSAAAAAAWARYFIVAKAPSHTHISPRLAISHPLDQHSKVYFNYGHFFTQPRVEQLYTWRYNRSGTGFGPIPDPSLDMPETIMYELAFEREFTNGLYARFFGMKPEMQFLVRIAGFYKDETRGIGDPSGDGRGFADPIQYYVTATDLTQEYINNRYSQMRGFELRIEKRVGRFFTGWFQGALTLRDNGNVGNSIETRTGQGNVPFSVYAQTSLAEPTWSTFLSLHTPRRYSVFGLPTYVTELWTLSGSATYTKGALFVYNPENVSPAPPANARYRDNLTSTLRVAKGWGIGKVIGEVYVDISNILGYKTLSTLGMTSQEVADYLKSLHLPNSYSLVQGNDRYGDWPSYAVIPTHDSWADYLNPRTYTLGIDVSF